MCIYDVGIMLNKVAREGLFGEVTFENKFESSEAMNQVNIRGVWGLK